MEQSFSKADRCYHTGRFGPKAADLERRCMSVLSMQEKDNRDLIARARRIYASAVTRHKGKQKKARMDKGLEKKKSLTSEATFLRKKRSSVATAIANLQTCGPGARACVEGLPLTDKGRKELALQKRRRFDRSLDAADNGYLLQEDEGEEPFRQLPALKRKHVAQDQKRMETMARRCMLRRNVCEAQAWNWKSLGNRSTWCDFATAPQDLLPLRCVQVARTQCFKSLTMSAFSVLS